MKEAREKMSETALHGCKRYALRGVVMGGGGTVLSVEFDAYDDADAWKQADYVELPKGFMAVQMAELSDGAERNVPPSMAAIAAVIDGVLAKPPNN